MRGKEKGRVKDGGNIRKKIEGEEKGLRGGKKGWSEDVKKKKGGGKRIGKNV